MIIHLSWPSIIADSCCKRDAVTSPSDRKRETTGKLAPPYVAECDTTGVYYHPILWLYHISPSDATWETNFQETGSCFPRAFHGMN